ncbi:MAG: MFS transporter [Desulfomonilaceae bacterium]
MKYFNRIFLLLVLMWGAVGLERMVAVFVLPGIQKDFSLNYAQSGAIIAVFAFGWAIGTWAMGSLSDYVGRKVVIVVLVIFGGLCSWVTGLATGLAMMLVIRAIMGFAEGGIWGPVSATIAEESSPMTRARNVGMLPALFTLCGAAIGPILSTQLMAHYGWRSVFYIYAIPGVVLGLLIWLVMKEPASTQAILAARRSGGQRQQRRDAQGQEIGYWDVFKYRNIILMMVTWIFNMAFLWLFTTFGMIYMEKIHHLPLTTAGLAMSGFGFGAFLGCPVFGFISDHIGRKKAIVLCQLVGGVIGIGFVLLSPGVGLPVLFAFVMATAFCAAGMSPILLSISAETVGFAMAATAIGAITGVGELIGGGILPVVGGGIADAIGLSAALYLATACLIAGAVCGLFVQETAPRIVSKIEAEATLVTRGQE